MSGKTVPLAILVPGAALLCAQESTQHCGSTAAILNQMWSGGRATGTGLVKLQSFPLRLDDIGFIIPMGLMQSGHTTPSDHLDLVPIGIRNPLHQGGPPEIRIIGLSIHARGDMEATMKSAGASDYLEKSAAPMN